jgi:hypothetical protein
MFSYRPPLKDIHFVLNELFQAAPTLAAYPQYTEVDGDLITQIVEEAGKFAAEVLFPLNATGDREGCQFENQAVRTPAGFADAYRQFREAGWPALACDPEYGGQGLPHTLNSVLYEMLTATNHAWTMFPGLLHGAYACMHKYATDDLKALYLPKLVSGEWLATMCLTEPQAGSDLGLLRTKAVPSTDGSYAITGNKIFISGGDQDMTENIVHLVLARLPDAPAGSKGISLFVVPKFVPDEQGKPGARNTVVCTGIEHKMGIHGSPTCSMAFDNAKGWLIGEPHRGLAAMFVMINSARLQVGINGIGAAETAFQNALAYANERLQLRAVDRPESRRKEPADPIVMHPAVQRLLMTQRTWVEGGRMLAYFSALLLDGAEHHPDAEQRRQMDARLALLTPIIKAMLTEQGFQGTSQAMQIFGGHGFVCETGIEQYMRDVRITLLYEGTNEIQAIDLINRKILADQGQQLFALLDEIEQTAATAPSDHARFVGQINTVCATLRRLVQAIGELAPQHPQLPYRVAPEMLRLTGHALFSWFWLQAFQTAASKESEDPAFYRAKQHTAHYYFGYVWPEVHQLTQVIEHNLEACSQDAGINYLQDLLES